MLHAGGETLTERCLVVGLGKESSFSLDALRQVSSDAAKMLAGKQLASFVLALPPS